MKQYRFHWNGRFWSRQLNEHSGDTADRLAQIGNALLNEGFRISIDDPAIRERAISADFAPEHSRWIMRGMTGRHFFIDLPPDIPPQIRQNLLRIPTASYRYGSVLVELSHYEELEDFAQMYGFRFDQEAASLLNRYKSLIKNARPVQPVFPDPPQSLDMLRRILESSGSILEDLSDEDELT